MDRRHTEIVEGQGLVESRLNQDFIDWLRKWGFWILLVLAIASLSYAGMKHLENLRQIALDDAFQQYRDASASGSPDSLLAVASDFRGKGAVSQLAMTDAANIYLKSARTGVAPGGLAGLDDDLLDDNARLDMAKRAKDLYQQVYNATKNDSAQFTLTVGAQWGLAATSVIEKNFDAARTTLAAIAEESSSQGFDMLSELATKRLAELDALELAAPLPRNADLPPRPDLAGRSGEQGIPYSLEAPTPEVDGPSSEFSPFIDPELSDLKVPAAPTPEEPPAEQPPAEETEGGSGGDGEG